MVESNYDEYVKIKNENEKLKKDLKKLSTTNTIVVENLDHDSDLPLENEMIKEENKILKKEKKHDELKEENKKLKLEKNISRLGRENSQRVNIFKVSYS